MDLPTPYKCTCIIVNYILFKLKDQEMLAYLVRCVCGDVLK